MDTIRNKSMDKDDENLGISDIIGELNNYAQNASHTLSGIFGEFLKRYDEGEVNVYHTNRLTCTHFAFVLLV